MTNLPLQSKKERYHTVWTTAWGPMAAAATDGGVTRIELPHYQPDDLRQMFAWQYPNAEEAEAPFRTLIELSQRYFNAERVDFSEVVCELPSPESFTGKVLRACREIPYGRTRSYSDLAKAIERPDAARAVATAMGKNPLPLVVPCHRVTYADGRVGGFSAAGGVELKQRMLELESRNQ
ncbi:MAG: methylated-DNA--[protein]-cysteine S-methyltransferase [Phycisphaerae bacterium]